MNADYRVALKLCNKDLTFTLEIAFVNAVKIFKLFLEMRPL